MGPHQGRRGLGPWAHGISYADDAQEKVALDLIEEITHFVTDDASDVEMFLKREGNERWRVLLVNYIHPAC